jgi:hypothetical protein
MTDMLDLTRVTADVGATIKPGPMVTAPPDRAVTDDVLKNVAEGAGINGPLLADLLVAMAIHENTSINMYRALRSYTLNPMLHSAFSSFEQDALEAVGIYTELGQELGVPKYYISPAGRMTEGLNSHMVMSLLASGSADAVTADMKAVEMVMLGANMCVANTMLLAELAEEVDDDHVKGLLMDAVGKLIGPQRHHLEWAIDTRRTMAMTMLQHPVGHKLLTFAENVVAKVKGVAP